MKSDLLVLALRSRSLVVSGAALERRSHLFRLGWVCPSRWPSILGTQLAWVCVSYVWMVLPEQVRAAPGG